MKYSEKAPAKINLAIDVLGKRPDGYHDVEIIMQSIALYDTVTVKALKTNEILVKTDSNLIPAGKENIAYKAAELLKNKYKIKYGAEIYIEKNIPIAAGLGGGSADAAATIRLLDKLWRLKLSRIEMEELGVKVGADVPFCLQGCTALAQGLGERLTCLDPLPDCYIILAKPEIGISTKEVYEGLNIDEIKQRPDIEGIIAALREGDLKGIASRVCNVLETVAEKKCNDIITIKDKLIECGALGSAMSGSGPTVFGIFDQQSKACEAYDYIRFMADESFLVKTSNR